MRLLACALALALVVIGPAYAVELSDARAKEFAVHMEKVVAAGRESLNGLIKGGDRARYRGVVRDKVQLAVNEWPKDSRDNRTIFPYFSCRQAAVSLLQYGDAWSRSDDSDIWRNHVTKNFRSDYADCRAAIAKPDLNLKDIH